MTSARPTFQVTVTREDNLWVAVVADLAGGATDVERLADLDTEVRDLIAGLRDLDPDAFEIDWHYQQGNRDLTPVLAKMRDQDARATEAIRQRDEVRQTVIAALRQAGLSYRVIADLVGLSYQRVQQIATGQHVAKRRQPARQADQRRAS